MKRECNNIHLKAWLNMHKNVNTLQPWHGGWMLRGQLADPNAMDTLAGRSRGRITGSEEINFNTPLYAPQGGFFQRGGHRGGQGHPKRDLSEVECYTCHKKGHLSHNCLQHIWNKGRSQGCEAIVDESLTQTPQQWADTWLRSMANEGEDIQELVMRDLVGREDFQGTWTHQPG